MKWAEIKNFDGYFISENGIVRSIDRFISHPRSGNGKQFVKGRIHKKQLDKDGYEVVGLHIDGKNRLLKVHRLVAEAFIDNPNNYPIINHINCNRADNRVHNLEWCNNSHNQKHAFKVGRQDSGGERHSQHKLKKSDIFQIFADHLNGLNQSEIGRKHGVSSGAISRILLCKGWRKTCYDVAFELMNCVLIEIEKLDDRFPCSENAHTVKHLKEAIAWQEIRTRNRERRGVEGTNQI